MTIAEVSARCGLTADTLRYYERVGLIPAVKRTAGGIRNYDESDCSWIDYIKCMRGAGIPVETLIEYVALFKGGEKTIAARKQILLDQKKVLENKIRDIQEVLDRLDWKIDGYEDRMVEYEKRLKRKTE